MAERWYARRNDMSCVCGHQHDYLIYSDSVNADSCNQVLAYPACARVDWADFDAAPEYAVIWNQHYPPCPNRDMPDHYHDRPIPGMAMWCNGSRLCPGGRMLSMSGVPLPNAMDVATE